MSYEQLVDFMANSQLEGKSIVFEGEVANAFIAVTDKEKLSTDVAAACERIKAEREGHKENNTPEYQKAKEAYDKLVAKYVEYLNAGESLLGVYREDEIALEECAKYGVDVSHFYDDITKAAHSEIAVKPRKIDSKESTMKM